VPYGRWAGIITGHYRWLMMLCLAKESRKTIPFWHFYIPVRWRRNMCSAPATHEPDVPLLAGVDGCRAGWVVVGARCDAQDAQGHRARIWARFDDVLSREPAPAVIAVDMPIGLLAAPQPGGRDCDRLARRLLGRRASSVFTPPARPLLEATHYAQV